MLWACIAVSGTGNISPVEGRMDSTTFQQNLDSNLTGSVKKLRREWLLQMDNDLKHLKMSNIKRHTLKVLQ